MTSIRLVTSLTVHLFHLQITRVSQENLAGRIVAIDGYPFCDKTSTVTPIFYCIFEMF